MSRSDFTPRPESRQGTDPNPDPDPERDARPGMDRHYQEHGNADTGTHRRDHTTRGDFDSRLNTAAADDHLGRGLSDAIGEPRDAAGSALPDPVAEDPVAEDPVLAPLTPEDDAAQVARTRPRDADRVGLPRTWGGTGRAARRGAVGRGAHDGRIQDEVCARIAQMPDIDPTDVVVGVQDGRVILDGTVPAAYMQERMRDLANDVAEVKAVDDRLRVSTAPIDEPFRTPGEQGRRHI